MNCKPIVVMNFSGVYEQHQWLASHDCHWVDCTHIIGANRYCDEEAQCMLSYLLHTISVESIHLLDNGNYHYLSYFFACQIQKEYNLLLIDHHPDMQKARFDGVLSCGGWVRTLLDKQPHLKSVYMMGVNEDNLFSVISGYEDKVKLIHDVSQVGIEPLYVSVDLDVLSREFMVTNWDQGEMSLSKLEQTLLFLMSHRKIIGLDLCGEDDRGMIHSCNMTAYEKLLRLTESYSDFVE